MNSDPARYNPVEPDHQFVITKMQKKLQQYEEEITSIKSEVGDEDVIDLRELWNVLVRRKWTVFGTLIVLPAGTMIVTMMTPSYRISATLKVEEFTENKGVPINVTVAELIKYLKSHSLARQVIKQLNLQDSFDAKKN